MQRVEKIDVGQAADMLDASVLNEITIHGGMKATTLMLEGQKVVLVQASGGDFLLIR